jgi:hypothetical protein
MRKLLINSQSKEGCASGSWDPDRPGKDAWSQQGGRHYATTLSCLTLEIYYRYLPLYKVDKEDNAGAAPAAGKADKDAKKADPKADKDAKKAADKAK